jgi:hypothetical protein
MGKWSDEETAALHSLLSSFGGFEDATADGNTSCARRIVASGRIPSRSVEQLKDKLKDMRRASLAGSRKEADGGGVAAGGRSKKAAAAPARAAAPAAAATTVARARKGVAPAKPQVSARVRRAAAAPLLALPAPPASTASSSASSTVTSAHDRAEDAEDARFAARVDETSEFGRQHLVGAVAHAAHDCPAQAGGLGAGGEGVRLHVDELRAGGAGEARLVRGRRDDRGRLDDARGGARNKPRAERRRSISSDDLGGRVVGARREACVECAREAE